MNVPSDNSSRELLLRDDHIAENQMFRCLEGRVLQRKESLPVREIPSRKLPFEAAYGVMMRREESECTRFNSVLVYGGRFVVACPTGTHFLPVSPTLDDIRCRSLATYARF